MSKKEYIKQIKEGNTNMDYDTWEMWNNFMFHRLNDYNTSWHLFPSAYSTIEREDKNNNE